MSLSLALLDVREPVVYFPDEADGAPDMAIRSVDYKSGKLFCGDIDGVPLGQRGVLPGPTQINLRALVEARPMLPGARATSRTPSTKRYTPIHFYIELGSHC
ncbi:jg13153 [Pararge aegeria aegeria]|uniref:Jg13153 protein n=1 Tax=Pararge aegeria aegeria TaxID=348720 RepID=A0A8S4RV54_9NEOP|nr:jg13153 [Pararge aegeria aegeria]